MVDWYDTQEAVKAAVKPSNRPHEMMEMRNKKTFPNIQAETSANSKNKSVENSNWGNVAPPPPTSQNYSKNTEHKNTKSDNTFSFYDRGTNFTNNNIKTPNTAFNDTGFFDRGNYAVNKNLASDRPPGIAKANNKNIYHFDNDNEGFIDIDSLPFDDDKTYGDMADEQDDLIDWWYSDKDKGLNGLGASLFGKSNINHANHNIASTHSIAKKIQELNPEWTWHEVLNFIQGDYHEDGRKSVLGKYTNEDGLALAIPNKRGDKWKSINPDTWAVMGIDLNDTSTFFDERGKTKHYNTFSGGLRGNWEMNTGELMDRESYTTNLNMLGAKIDPSNKDLFQQQRNLIDRVKFFNPHHGKSGLAKVFLGALAGFGGVPGMLATQAINSKATAEGTREPLDQKLLETLVAPFTPWFEQEGIGENGIESMFASSGGIIINDKTSLANKYNLSQYHYDETDINKDNPSERHSMYNPQKYTSEDAVSPETKYGQWIGTDETEAYSTDFIDSDGDGVDDRWQSGPGEPSQKPGESQGTSTAATNNPAWMDFSGGFERLFTAKEGGIVGFMEKK